MNITVTSAVIASVALGIGAALLLLYANRKKRRGFFIRFLAALCLLSAIIGIQLEKDLPSGDALLLLDISDSMDPDRADEVLHSLQQKMGDNQVTVIPFGASTAPIGEPLSGISSFRSIQGRWSKLDVGVSNLQAALQSVQNAEKIFLLSDGFENGGDVTRVLPNLRERSMPVYPLSPESAEDTSSRFALTQLHAPLIAPARSSVDVRVTVSNTTNSIQTGSVFVTHDGKLLRQEDVSVQPGKEIVLIVPSDPSQEGIKEIKAELKPASKGMPSSSEVIFLSGQSREKILLVSGTTEDETLLKQVLGEQSYQLTHLIANESATKLPPFTDFRSVVFNNVSLKQLEAVTAENVKKFVAGGGGFMMIGGNKSFGLGGYKDTSIETVLPVSMVPPQTEQKRLNVAVQLVLDKSQSMAADGKIEFVKEAARESIRSLKNDDYVGVIPFDSVPFLLIRMAQVAGIRNEAIDKISRIFPTGSTNLMPALQAAKQELERVPAGRKHIIILTDGKLPDGERGYFWYVEQVKQLRMTGVTVSTVMLGPESDTQLLRELAQTGGGSFYQTTDPNRLPQIFLSDIKVSTGEKTLKESVEFDIRRGPSGIKSTGVENYPPVLGYVQTKVKEGADLELIAYAAQVAEPLLASWKYEKGKAAAFTSDANGRWSRLWVEWPRFREFWRDLLQSLKIEGTDTTDVKFELRPFIERGSLVLDLAVFSRLTDSSVEATIDLPSGQSQTVSFEKRSEGHFKALIDRPLAGTYTVRTLIGKKPVTPIAFSISGEAFGEQKHKGYNMPFLERIAGETGGVVNPPREISVEKQPQKKEYTDISYWLLLGALFLLGMEIYLREVRRVKPL